MEIHGFRRKVGRVNGEKSGILFPVPFIVTQSVGIQHEVCHKVVTNPLDLNFHNFTLFYFTLIMCAVKVPKGAVILPESYPLIIIASI